MKRICSRSIIFIIVLLCCIFLTSICFGQETGRETTATSKLAGIALPANTERITEKSIIDQLRPELKQLVERYGRGNRFAATIKDILLGIYTITANVKTPDGKVYTPSLNARIAYPDVLGNRFITDASNPIFFGSLWKDFPEGNGGDPNEAVYKKRSRKSGVGSVTMEIAHF